jgi:hypothetical protein
MNPLVLRDELPPADTVVVVRGGEMNSEFVRASAQDASMTLVSLPSRCRSRLTERRGVVFD